MKFVKRATPFLNSPSQCDPLEETYQVKSCDKIISGQTASISSPSEQRKVLPLKIMGVTVTGIDPRLISSVSLSINAPLKAGCKKFIGVQKDARIRIRKNTQAHVSLELQRDALGHLLIKRFSISFNRSLIIKNPATAFTPASKNSKFSASVQDKLADVRIKKITVDETGSIVADGKIVKLRLLKTRISRTITRVTLPKFDEAFLEALGLFEPDTKHAVQERLTLVSEKLDLNKVLTRLSSMTGQANYEISIKGDRSRMSILKDNIYFRGPTKPIDVSLKGVLHLNDEGNLLIIADGTKSHISCSLGEFTPQIAAEISHVGIARPTTFNLEASLEGSCDKLRVDMFAKQAVVNILPRQCMVKTTVSRPKMENQFNASLGAETLQVTGRVGIKGTIGSSTEIHDGTANISFAATNPYAKTLERGAVIDGKVMATFDVKELAYSTKEGIMSGTGESVFGVEPSSRSLEKFPELTAVDYRYGLEMRRGGRLRLFPPDYGLTRLIRPVMNLEGHHERVNGSLTKTPLFPIGSDEYFAHVQKITGAKLRRARNVKLLIDGVASLPERLKLIARAKDSICFQTFVFRDDESGWMYAKALCAAAKRGVRVRGIIDSVGNISSLQSLLEPNPIYQYLRDNGVELYIYNGAAETALRSIFQIVQKYRTAFTMSNPQSLTSVAQVVRFFDCVIEVSDNEQLLNAKERRHLKKAIHVLLYGNEDVAPDVAVSELRDALRDNMTTFDEMLLLIKRMGKVSYRWHEKYLIVDKEHAIVGGMNIADEYFLGGTGRKISVHGKMQTAWRDSDASLEGDIVSDIYRAFRRNWLHVAHERLEFGKKVSQKTALRSKDDCVASFMQNRPFEDGDHKIVDFLLYNLRTLKPGEKAWFETAYFLPRGILKTLQHELVQAARRGVDVRIITNSASSGDFGPLVEASVFDVRELLEANARVYFRNSDRLVHAKVMVLGDKLTMMGSWNCDNRSGSHDSEDMCNFFSHRINEEMTRTLIKDMVEQSYEVKLDALSAQKINKELRAAGMLLMAELV